MVNLVLLNLLESVLGKGKPTARGNYAFTCPNCNHHKPKLEVCLDPEEVSTKGKSIYQHYGCWTCNFRGEKISTLLKKIKAPKSKFEELNLALGTTDAKPNYDKYKNFKIELPTEFISLKNKDKLSITGRHAYKYITKKRNLTSYDIEKYNIGYCEEGKYENRIIIPSYDSKGELNYFISRSFLPDEPRKYNNPPSSRDIIPFELFINWDLPIILCEGVFDAISLKRNTIPLLGKTITEGLMKKLISSKVNKIYIVLDNDAIKTSIQHCELLINEGKKVYFVNLPGKDPAEIGFINMLDILYKTTPLTLSDLMKLKLDI